MIVLVKMVQNKHIPFLGVLEDIANMGIECMMNIVGVSL